MKFLKKNNEDKINKSKEIIKREKERIKEEKKKIKATKRKNKQHFLIPLKKSNQQSNTSISLFSAIYFIITGFFLCLVILFVLSGGKNYLKLYYELNKLIDTYDTITSKYYGDLSKNQLVDNAIDSMLNSVGDDYTTYSDTESTNEFDENLDGTYEGIGCTVTVNEEGKIIVASVFENSPAEKAGLQENDIITAVDGKDYSNKSSTDVSNYVKNSSNNKITLTIIRNGQEQELTIKRNKVEIPTVTSRTYTQDEKKIGYIKISIFSSVTTEQFKTALTKLEKDEEIEALIIDVRDNTGGYLSTVTDIASLFLEKNKIIYQLEDDKGTSKIKDTTKEKRTYPVTILINGASASASEILASAIKESYDGEIVGVNSYGKGTVQKTKKLSDGSMIKYTVQKWLTPDGNWINETGVTPTTKVELDLTSENDNQLETALKITRSKLK